MKKIDRRAAPRTIAKAVRAASLQLKILFLYVAIAASVLAAIGVVVPGVLFNQSLARIGESLLAQMRHVDFALSGFIGQVKDDVRALSLDPDVREPADAAFTTFLGADEKTFRYRIGARERKVIETLNNYRLTHPPVASVYMGRENGSFVRSHPRERPTDYDPRARPWYVLARTHPGRVMVTEPYPAVTTADVNIGVVTALQDDAGRVYGVVGADITLARMTGYVSGFRFAEDASMILIDSRGVILAHRDTSQLFRNADGLLRGRTREILASPEGMTALDGRYLAHYTSPALGWKIGVIVPAAAIARENERSMRAVLAVVASALALLVAVTLAVHRRAIIRPRARMTAVSAVIADTGDLTQRIGIVNGGEIGRLAGSFNTMVEKLGAVERERQNALDELAAYRDHLEELVARRTSELEEARDRAESADRLKSSFLAVMSHELRTPLNSIIGFSGVLLQELAGPLNAEQKKQLTMVARSSEHLLALINDILDISKIEAGQLTVEKAPFALFLSFQKVIDLLRPQAESKGLRLEASIDPLIGPVTGDRRRFEQVLLNLAGNAIKFTERGSVTVACDRRDGRIRVAVADTGIGIKEGDRETLFQPFRQVETGLARKYEGTGLGLSICKRLADLMGGDISLESEWGRGSTFTLTLPDDGGRN